MIEDLKIKGAGFTLDHKKNKVINKSDMIFKIVNDACVCLAIESIKTGKEYVITLDKIALNKFKRYLGDLDE